MTKKPAKAVTPTTQGAARRVQSAVAIQHGGNVPKGNYSTRLTSAADRRQNKVPDRSEEHTSELQSLMRISYAVFCLKKKKQTKKTKYLTLKTPALYNIKK